MVFPVLAIVIGIAVLLWSANRFVDGAAILAKRLGMSQLLIGMVIAQSLQSSELTIGLTIVAIGTSLPELASSLAAARKNHHDIVIGNIIGSNLFNTLMVVGIAGAIHPMKIPSMVVYRDLFSVGVATMVLVAFCFQYRRPRVSRSEQT